ncbi:hypothetical protein GQ600_25197 [Phytophthora cactorum]|nr:hypothetical protein GQ600_25197 [Phytophthora cactorum]
MAAGVRSSDRSADRRGRRSHRLRSRSPPASRSCRSSHRRSSKRRSVSRSRSENGRGAPVTTTIAVGATDRALARTPESATNAVAATAMTSESGVVRAPDPGPGRRLRLRRRNRAKRWPLHRLPPSLAGFSG